MVYRILLGGTDRPNDTGSILSTIFGTIWPGGLRYLGQEGRYLDPNFSKVCHDDAVPPRLQRFAIIIEDL